MQFLKPTAGILCLLVATACHSEASHNHENEDKPLTEKAEAKDEHGHADEIILSPEKAKAAGLKIETVAAGDFSGVLPVSGKVMPAAGDETTVVASVAGVVRLNRSMPEGTQVGSGTSLFTISTSELQDGDISQRATIAYQNAKADYERAEKLIADKLITEKEYIAAKGAYDTAKLAYNAVGNGGSAKGVQISAPAGGYVKECLVKDGDYVGVGQPMMTVTQNKNLYLRAEVPEREYAMLPKISSANFKTSYSDEVFSLADLNGRMVSYGRTSGADSPFVPVIFEFANRGGIFPGSYAEIFLLTEPRPNVISIPVSALTEEQGVYFVYLQVDEEGYRKQEVKLGDSNGERVEVISGLHPGEKLVTEGAIHVKLASAEKAIPGHTHNH